MAQLLIVHHCPTPTVSALADAVVEGATHDAIDGVEVVVRAALHASTADVLAADGFVLGTPANFGYMSGALKHLFDTVFLEAGGSLSDDGNSEPTRDGRPGGSVARKPWGLWVHGRYDTTGAIRSVESIVQALPWRQVAPVLSVVGDVGADHLDAARDLGGTVAANLMN